MSLDLTASAINEFYDILYSIDHSLEAIVVSMDHIATHLENICNNLEHQNQKEM